jgi:glucosamine-6-phosphate deaminase
LPLRAFHYIDADRDPEVERLRLGAAIAQQRIDVAFAGIGENGHIAFNEPPADFGAADPYLLVELSEASRRQQVQEGWFPRMEDVPPRAITMSVPQIMKASAIVCCASEERKARAVAGVVEGPVTPDVPASILQRHPRATLYLDRAAASLLRRG